MKFLKQFEAWATEINQLLNKFNINISEEEITTYWQEPHRGYHSINHLDKLLDDIKKLNLEKSMREKLILVALFHDIIYRPERNDNEEKSAEFFLSKCDNINDDIREVSEAILATKTHTSNSKLSEIFNYLDMKIVESDYDELLNWELGIQKEYLAIYRKEDYKKGRIEFLKSLLDKYPNNADNLKKLIFFVRTN